MRSRNLKMCHKVIAYQVCQLFHESAKLNKPEQRIVENPNDRRALSGRPTHTSETVRGVPNVPKYIHAHARLRHYRTRTDTCERNRARKQEDIGSMTHIF